MSYPLTKSFSILGKFLMGFAVTVAKFFSYCKFFQLLQNFSVTANSLTPLRIFLKNSKAICIQILCKFQRCKFQTSFFIEKTFCRIFSSCDPVRVFRFLSFNFKSIIAKLSFRFKIPMEFWRHKIHFHWPYLIQAYLLKLIVQYTHPSPMHSTGGVWPVSIEC